MTDYAGQIGEAMETNTKNYDKIAAKHLAKNKKPCDCENRWDIEHHSTSNTKRSAFWQKCWQTFGWI
jgi:hypothetical protein